MWSGKPRDPGHRRWGCTAEAGHGLTDALEPTSGRKLSWWGVARLPDMGWAGGGCPGPRTWEGGWERRGGGTPAQDQTVPGARWGGGRTRAAMGPREGSAPGAGERRGKRTGRVGDARWCV